MLDIHGAAAAGAVADAAAVADVADRVVGDPGDADRDVVLALADQAVPGALGGGHGLGQRLLAVLAAATAEGI
ncbi:MAG TPA: hypothetical protein VGH33_12730, partial [Isosphaeraceae bacterium]